MDAQQSKGGGSTIVVAKVEMGANGVGANGVHGNVLKGKGRDGVAAEEGSIVYTGRGVNGQRANGSFQANGFAAQFSEVDELRKRLHSLTTDAGPVEVLETDKVRYVVEGYLVPPNGNHGGMNCGIRLLRHPNGEHRVEKRINMSTPYHRERSRSEKAVITKLTNAGPSSHINILYDSLYRADYEANGVNIASIIVEHCDRGCLQTYIEKERQLGGFVQEDFLWHVLAGLCAALSMCHFGIKDPLRKHIKIQDWNTICHLDVKPANIFMSSKRAIGHEEDVWPRIVLGDFGCAVTRDDIFKHGKHPKDEQPYGTPGWFPPENVFIPETGQFLGRYGKPTDIWQMGAVIQALCHLADVPNQHFVDAGLPCGDHYSVELNYVVRECMHHVNKMRPTAVDVADMVRLNQMKLGLIPLPK